MCLKFKIYYIIYSKFFFNIGNIARLQNTVHFPNKLLQYSRSGGSSLRLCIQATNAIACLYPPIIKKKRIGFYETVQKIYFKICGAVINNLFFLNGKKHYNMFPLKHRFK